MLGKGPFYKRPILSNRFSTALSKASKTSDIANKELHGGVGGVDERLEGFWKNLIKWGFQWVTNEEASDALEKVWYRTVCNNVFTF